MANNYKNQPLSTVGTITKAVSTSFSYQLDISYFLANFRYFEKEKQMKVYEITLLSVSVFASVSLCICRCLSNCLRIPPTNILGYEAQQITLFHVCISPLKFC
jgi:hypothetical protein